MHTVVNHVYAHALSWIFSKFVNAQIVYNSGGTCTNLMGIETTLIPRYNRSTCYNTTSTDNMNERAHVYGSINITSPWIVHFQNSGTVTGLSENSFSISWVSWVSSSRITVRTVVKSALFQAVMSLSRLLWLVRRWCSVDVLLRIVARTTTQRCKQLKLAWCLTYS